MRVLVCVSRRVRAAEPEVCRAQRMAARAVAASIATLILLHIKNGMLFAGRPGRGRARAAPAGGGRGAGPGGGGRRPPPRRARRARRRARPAPPAGPALSIEPCGAWETSAKKTNGY
jgi:hypothetical protein